MLEVITLFLFRSFLTYGICISIKNLVLQFCVQNAENPHLGRLMLLQWWLKHVSNLENVATVSALGLRQSLMNLLAWTFARLFPNASGLHFQPRPAYACSSRTAKIWMKKSVQTVCQDNEVVSLTILFATSRVPAQDSWSILRSVQPLKTVSSCANQRLDADGSPSSRPRTSVYFTKAVWIWMNLAVTASVVRGDAVLRFQQLPHHQRQQQNCRRKVNVHFPTLKRGNRFHNEGWGSILIIV